MMQISLLNLNSIQMWKGPLPARLAEYVTGSSTYKWQQHLRNFMDHKSFKVTATRIITLTSNEVEIKEELDTTHETNWLER